MSAHQRDRRAIVTVTMAVSLLLAACGGGGGSDGTSSSDGSGKATTTVPTEGATIPDLTAEPHEFAEVDGSKARFINLLEDQGEAVDMDVYWGTDSETGKKATTIAYGDVSDWMPIEVDQEPFLTPADGSQQVDVAFYPKGETDHDELLMQKSETIDGDVLFTFTMGTGDGVGVTDGRVAASLGVGYDHEAGDPPAGKAWVAINTSGVGGIEGGDFMILSTADGCDDLTSTDIEGGTANSGQAFLVDPGPSSFTASDANTECAERTDPVDIDLEDGDQYVIYAFGTSMDDRQLMAVKVGE